MTVPVNVRNNSVHSVVGVATLAEGVVTSTSSVLAHY